MRIFLFFAVVFLFFSCSNQASDADFSSKDTLRAETERMIAAFEWTEELEKNRLSETKSRENVSSGVKLSPLSVISAIPQNKDEKTFPFVEGFSSLDISAIPAKLKNRLDSFCEKFIKKEDVDSFMASGCLYSLALFYADFEKDFSFSEKDSWILGKPAAVGTGFEIPVRFGKSFDVLLFWILENGSWKIDQIQRKYAKDSDSE